MTNTVTLDDIKAAHGQVAALIATYEAQAAAQRVLLRVREAAKAWAASVGGELPTRREQSLLFANAKQHFDEAYYWSSQQHADDGAYAWTQFFDDGYQYSTHTSYEARVRAVRRFKA